MTVQPVAPGGGSTIPQLDLPSAAGPTFGGGSEAPQVGVGYTNPFRTVTRDGRAVVRRDPWERERTPVQAPSRVFETQSADVVLRALFDMPDPELRALQTQLYDAGFYGNVSKKAIVFGRVDDATWGAFGDLLNMTIQYNTSGTEVAWFEVLDDVQRLRREQGTNLLDEEGREKREPLTVRLTNPADIERVAHLAATEVYGAAPSPEQVSRIVALYQAQEAAYQRAAYNAGPTGGVVTEPASLETVATDALEQADPLAAQANTVADEVVATFQSLLSGPFDGA